MKSIKATIIYYKFSTSGIIHLEIYSHPTYSLKSTPCTHINRKRWNITRERGRRAEK